MDKEIVFELDGGQDILNLEVKETTKIAYVREKLREKCAPKLDQFAAVELKLSLITDGNVVELNPTALHTVIPDGSTVVIHHPEYKKEDTGLQARVAKLEIRDKWNSEVALRLFDNVSGCGSVGFEADIKSEAWEPSNFGCAICGAKAPGQFSVAHILAGDPEKADLVTIKQAHHAVNRPRFKDDYEFRSLRNAFVLCGKDKNHKGSCHWAYDHHLVGIFYNALTQQYMVHWFSKDHLSERQLNTTKMNVNSKFNPRKRGFAFHALEGMRRFALLENENLLSQFTDCLALSVATEEAKAGDSETASSGSLGESFGTSETASRVSLGTSTNVSVNKVGAPTTSSAV